MTTNLTAAAPQAGYEVSSDTRGWAVAAHLSAFVTFFGIPSVIGPLVVWLIHSDDPYVTAHAKEAVNFNLSFLIYGVVAAVSIILLVGILALPAVLITWFVLVIVASIRARDNEDYRYPMTIRFID